MRLALVLLIASCSPAIGEDRETPSPLVNGDESSVVYNSLPSPSVETLDCDNGFWFLTTHHSPQSFDYSAPQFRPVVSRYDEGSTFRQSSLSELAAQLQPGIPVCIVVHGSFVDLPSAGKESICTWRWLKNAGVGEPMQMIYFYWPSFKKISLTVQCDVNQLGRQAGRNGFYLADLIQQIPVECPTCLVGHSHGTRVIASSLHLMAGGTTQGLRHQCARVNGRQIRCVFAASALDHDWLNPGHRYDRALCSTECVLNLTNSSDRALRVYPLRLPLIARRALGLTGLSQRDRYRLGAKGQKVLDYSVAESLGAEHLWPNYFQRPQLAVTMRNYVYFPDQVSAYSQAASGTSASTR